MKKLFFAVPVAAALSLEYFPIVLIGGALLWCFLGMLIEAFRTPHGEDDEVDDYIMYDEATR